MLTLERSTARTRGANKYLSLPTRYVFLHYAGEQQGKVADVDTNKGAFQ